MKTKRNILFISHDASRSGAPILLLHFIEGLRKQDSDIEIDVIIAQTGPLVERFKKSARLLIAEPQKVNTLLNKAINKATSNKWSEYLLKRRFKLFLKPQYDHVISNTSAVGWILPYVSGHTKNITTYVHELNFTMSNFNSAENLGKVLGLSRHFFVPAQVVADNLIQNHGVNKEKISILRYYIPDIETKTINQPEDKDGFVIGSSGSSGWRKGFDLFVQLAIVLKDEWLKRDIKFMWIGVDKNSIEFKMAWHDVVNAGIGSCFLFIEQTDNVEAYLKDIDVFIMLSREDPYPVAVLEAALHKKPILCFENSGGACDLLKDDTGIIVPYLDINKMAEEIMKLMNAPIKRADHGNKAYIELKKRHVRENSLDVLVNYLNSN